MTKIFHEYFHPRSGGVAVPSPMGAREVEDPSFTFALPKGEVEIPKSGTAVIRFTLEQEVENHTEGVCRYTLRITGIDKVSKEKSKTPYKVASAQEAMKAVLDKEDDED